MSRNRTLKMTSGPAAKGQVNFLPLSTDANPANGVVLQGPDSVGASPLNLTLPASVANNGVYKSDAAGHQSVSLLVDANVDPAAAIARAKLAALTASRVMVTDGSGIDSVSAVTATELSYVGGVTSAIQTQLNNLSSGKQDASTAVTLTGTQTLTNKTLTAPVLTTPEVDIIIADEQSGTPSTPASGKVKLYAKTDNKFYKLDSNGIELAVGSGSGAGGINYIGNPDAESALTGWSTYLNTAQATPVTGTGGSPIISLVRQTVSPLRGIASFEITTPASNCQGNGASYDFAIDSTDQNKLLSVSFDWKPGVNFTTGTNSDIQIFIYDKDLSKVIPLSTASLANPGSFQATFQATGSTNYRLIFHVATTSAASYALYFDNVIVGPQVPVYGPAMSDWKLDSSVSFGGLGTPTSSSVFTRRVGDTLYVKGSIIVGTATATTAFVQLPSGMAIDTNKLSSNANGTQVGFGTGAYSSQTVAFDVSHFSEVNQILFYDGSTSNQIFIAYLTGTVANQITKSNGNGIFVSGQLFTFEFSVPILGWSTNVVSSTDKVYNISNYLANGTRVTGAPPTALGQYRSYLRNASARTFTETNGNPTTAPTSSDGIKLYGNVSWSAGDTSNQPSKYDIYVGTGKTVNLQAYSSTGRTGNVDIKPLQLDSTEAQGYNWSYDPTAGLVTIAPYYGTGSEIAHYYGGDANANNITSPIYFDLIVSDNAFTVQSVGPRSEIWVNAPTGYGSTNTFVRTWTTTPLKSIGSAITYTHDATNGDTFTINETGVYAITYSGEYSTTAGQGVYFNITLNSTHLTSAPLATSGEVIGLSCTVANGTYSPPAVTTLNLNAGDIIRAQTEGVTFNSVDAGTSFRITKVSG